MRPELIRNLSVEDKRRVNRVFNPSDAILPESRIGDHGAIQIEVDDFRKRSERATEEARRTSNVEDAAALYQGEDLEEVANAFEEQRIREETREEQEEDVSRLEKAKRWAKENIVGLSAVALSIAGIVTSIVVRAGRGAVAKGAQEKL